MVALEPQDSQENLAATEDLVILVETGGQDLREPLEMMDGMEDLVTLAVMD